MFVGVATGRTNGGPLTVTCMAGNRGHDTPSSGRQKDGTGIMLRRMIVAAAKDRTWLLLVSSTALTGFLLGLPCSANAASSGDYTQSQAHAGEQVYAQHCVQCHGSDLQGKAGPPLAGSRFAENLRFSKMSGQQLYDFIKTHMPANAPGSLSDEQYRKVFAYLLAQNGYPAGSKPLSSDGLGSVALLPYPGGHTSSSSKTSGSSN